MRRWLAVAALALVGCGGTLVERVNSAIDTGCTICDTISPLCSNRTRSPQVTVNVVLPATATTTAQAAPSTSASVAP